MKGVKIIYIDSPPVNALSSTVSAHLYLELSAAEFDDEVSIVLLCGKNGMFSAGADIMELSKKADEFSSQKEAIFGYVDAYKTYNLAPLVYRIDSFPKPVVALISGSALGGGLELALGCHYRIAMDNCKFSLPEVKIGIIPGALGTQLLPRLVDFKSCIDLCVYCKTITSDVAVEIGLIDQVIRDNGDDAYTFENCIARTLAVLEKQVMRGKDAPSPFRRTSTLLPITSYSESLPTAYQVLLKLPGPDRGGLASRAAVRCLMSALKYRAAFEPGALEESEMSKVLVASPESRALRYIFMSERLLQRLPGANDLSLIRAYVKSLSNGRKKVDDRNSEGLANKDVVSTGNSIENSAASIDVNSTSVKSESKLTVAVIGSGQMGTGIAVAILMSRMSSVILIDTSKEALDKAKVTIGGILSIAMSRGSLTPEAATELHRDRLQLTTDISTVSACDVVIEAVFESVEIKKKLFSELDSLTSEDCILCSNTSSLDIDVITSPVRNKSRIAGLHFFSPAHIMKLVEIIVASETSPLTIRKLMKLVKSMGKIGILAMNLPGFIGNRMIFNYVMESMLLLEEGYSVNEIDSAAFAFGFPMGPLQMQDLSGLDVGYKIRKEKGLLGCNDSRYSAIGDELYERGRLGVKSGKGFYSYPSAALMSQSKGYFDRLVEYFIFNSNFGAVNRVMASSLFSKSNRGEKSKFKGKSDPQVVEIVNIVRSRKLISDSPSGISRMTNNTDSNIGDGSARKTEILDRLLLPLINEGFKLLADGGVTSCRPSDVDLVFIYGFGFPAYKGGPLYYAENSIGLQQTLLKLKHYNNLFSQNSTGISSGKSRSNSSFEPAPLLIRMVNNSIRLKDIQDRPDLVRELMSGKAMKSLKRSKL